MAEVVVFALGEPRQRLMTWFLQDSGLDATRAVTLDEASAAVREPDARVIVFNTNAPTHEIAPLVRDVRKIAHQVRIIVLHPADRDADHEAIDADVCFHDFKDPDHMVEAVTHVLRDGPPHADDPHEAAEELT